MIKLPHIHPVADLREIARRQAELRAPFIKLITDIYASSPFTITFDPKGGTAGTIIYPEETERRVREIREQMEEVCSSPSSVMQGMKL